MTDEKKQCSQEAKLARCPRTSLHPDVVGATQRCTLPIDHLGFCSWSRSDKAWHGGREGRCAWGSIAPPARPQTEQCSAVCARLYTHDGPCFCSKHDPASIEKRDDVTKTQSQEARIEHVGTIEAPQALVTEADLALARAFVESNPQPTYAALARAFAALRVMAQPSAERAYEAYRRAMHAAWPDEYPADFESWTSLDQQERTAWILAVVRANEVANEKDGAA